MILVPFWGVYEVEYVLARRAHERWGIRGDDSRLEVGVKGSGRS